MVIQDVILKPLGELDIWCKQAAPFWQGYQKQGKKWVQSPPWNFGVIAPAGGLYSSVVDLGKFVEPTGGMVQANRVVEVCLVVHTAVPYA